MLKELKPKFNIKLVLDIKPKTEEEKLTQETADN